MFVELINTPRPYDWGDHDAIARWQGRPASGSPEAELWFGTHPGSPASVAPAGGAEAMPLETWLSNAGHPTGLPYLVKILAAAKPLSIQVHPSKGQARAGYVREDFAGIPLDEPFRNYKDSSDKPEILIAWSDTFEALVGFQSAGEMEITLDHIDVATGDGELTEPLRRALAEGPSELIAMVLSAHAAVAALASAITEAAQGPRPSGIPGEGFDLWNLWHRVVRHFPGDPGIVVASFMNRLSLSAGQALFVPAGIIHAYVEGYGLEVMAPSDNVLRGGLTAKHIDRDELAAIVHAEPSHPGVFQPTSPEPGVWHFAPSDVPFEVTRVESGSTVYSFEGTGPWVVVVESGTGLVTDGGKQYPVGAGSAYALASKGTPPRLEATGTIYVIGAP